jgi:hypothetical protein
MSYIPPRRVDDGQGSHPSYPGDGKALAFAVAFVAVIPFVIWGYLYVLWSFAELLAE